MTPPGADPENSERGGRDLFKNKQRIWLIQLRVA